MTAAELIYRARTLASTDTGTWWQRILGEIDAYDMRQHDEMEREWFKGVSEMYEAMVTKMAAELIEVARALPEEGVPNE